MSLLTGKGQAVKEQVNKGKVDLKKAFIRLKNENESVTVRVLGIDDYVSYKAHGEFSKGIYNTPCLAVAGDYCPYCTVKEHGGEEWDGFYAKDRYMFAFAVLGEDIKVMEVSKNQAKKLIADIDEYAEEIADGEIAFNLTRTGTGTSTAYSLKALTAKKFKAVEEQFQAFDGEVVEIEFFEERIAPKTPDYMIKLVIEAGFKDTSKFPADLLEKALAEGEKETVQPIQAVEETEADVI